jgi:hypothetical protein
MLELSRENACILMPRGVNVRIKGSLISLLSTFATLLIVGRNFGIVSNRPPSPALNIPPNEGHALELYKLEYERCATRYEDIYKAMWTNFSYLAVVAGAILTFGGTRLNPELTALISCLPLVFWFWATFLPLDRYGNKAALRLKAIEAIVNNKFNLKNDPNEFGDVGLDHYSGFYNLRHNAPFILRTKFVVIVFFFALHMLALIFIYKLYGFWLSVLLGSITMLSFFYALLENKESRTRLRYLFTLIALPIIGIAFVTICLYYPLPKGEKETKTVIINLKGKPLKVNLTEGENVIDVQVEGN